jgi:hypothetical protein
MASGVARQWLWIGLAGGFAGGLVMEGARWIGASALRRRPSSSMAQLLRRGQRLTGLGRDLGPGSWYGLASALSLGLATAFGGGYTLLARRRLMAAGPLTGALFGGALYLADTSAAGLLGAGTGVWQEPAGVTARRLALHLVYGAVLGLIARDRIQSDSGGFMALVAHGDLRSGYPGRGLDPSRRSGC